MQYVQETGTLRNNILDTLAENGLQEPALVHMLDYIIELFESRGLGEDYYGYHNILHELTVTYVMLISACSKDNTARLSDSDIKHLYTAALLHDFDPLKLVDKPHEMMVLKFISSDARIASMAKEAGISLPIVYALVLSTTYPWQGKGLRLAQESMVQCFEEEDSTRGNRPLQEHYEWLGRYLAVVDRIGGYVMGDFGHAVELAKMNAHALAWRPSLIVQRSVAYFEDLLNNETDILRMVMSSLPRWMRKNFFGTVLSFMQLRSLEISIQADYTYDNLRLVPTIETMETRRKPEFAPALLAIFDELPHPLQFGRERFEESVGDPDVILNTLRLGDGRIIGFAKGGPLEHYTLSPEIQDVNYGLYNTVFLEPLALKMGYWGMGGGGKMRHLFVMQSYSKRFTYLTSFALRDVIQARISKENAEFVKKIDPERWDYYRMRL